MALVIPPIPWQCLRPRLEALAGAVPPEKGLNLGCGPLLGARCVGPASYAEINQMVNARMVANRSCIVTVRLFDISNHSPD